MIQRVRRREPGEDGLGAADGEGEEAMREKEGTTDGTEKRRT
jgi:hypothetical protein